MLPIESIELSPGRRVYFASDFHLGNLPAADSAARERAVIAWLEAVRHDAALIFLVGDVFDFWFEYRRAVPKGFVRLLGKLAELSDAGLRIELFTGNHDLWMADYFPTELGIPVHHQPRRYQIGNKSFLVGHGDGLGPGDHTYKLLKRVFTNPLGQRLFRAVHPDLGIGLAQAWSRRSRISNDDKGEDQFLGEAREWLWQYCAEVEQTQHHDYYVFGHRHLPLDIAVTLTSRYINLGEWVKARTYAVFDGQGVRIMNYEL
jgi:UDP-2,3-diacylglucosamine hydrolase